MHFLQVHNQGIFHCFGMPEGVTLFKIYNMRNLIVCALLVVFVTASSFTNNGNTSTVHQDGLNTVTNLAGFDFFRTHRQGKDGITSTWGYTGGSVTGYVVERTYEDPADPYAYWETVALVPESGLRSYKVTNTSVTPGFISYRVKAMNGNTVVAATDVSTVHIVAH